MADKQASGSKLYNQLSEKQKGKLKAKDNGEEAAQGSVASRIYNLSDQTIADKMTNKHVSLSNPPKISKVREARLQRKAAERQRRKAILLKQHKLPRGIASKAERNALTCPPRKPTQSFVDWPNVALGLHRMWLAYMARLLDLQLDLPGPPTAQEPASDLTAAMDVEESAASASSEVKQKAQTSAQYSASVVQNWHVKLSKADFHGARITVTRTKNTSQIGLSGIVIQETACTWTIITPKSKVKVLPKQGSVFSFALPLKSTQAGPSSKQSLVFELAGSQFAHKPADRATRKFKNKIEADFGPVGVV